MDEDDERIEVEKLTWAAAQAAHPWISADNATVDAVALPNEAMMWLSVVFAYDLQTQKPLILSYAVDMATGEVVNSNR